VYAPERDIQKECRIVRILKYILPCTWRKVFRRPYFKVNNEMLDEMEKQVNNSINKKTNKPFAKMIYSVKELDEHLAQANEDRPIAVIHNIEGAHCLENSIDGSHTPEESLNNLLHFFDRGVAYLTLAHFYENELVSPCFPYPESVQMLGCFTGDRDLTRSLTTFGEQVVEKMIELGMIIDIAHCTPPARKRIFDIVDNKIPIIASHVGAYEINPSPYNLKDWEIKKIAETGGLSAVIFMNYWLMPHETKRGLNFIAKTLDHFKNVGGIDHVGIGTDFDGFIDPPDDLKDSSYLYKLTQRLMAEDYSEDMIKKIWGGNVLRVIRDGWGKKV